MIMCSLVEYAGAAAVLAVAVMLWVGLGLILWSIWESRK
jgi:hypothetical protein